MNKRDRVEGLRDRIWIRGILRLAVMCTAVLALGCTRSPDEGGDEEGSLSLALALDLSEIVVTKTEVAPPDVADFTIQIINGSGRVLKEWARLADVPAKVNIQAGRYTLKAFYGTNPDSEFEHPYYEGTTEFTVTARQTKSVSLTCALANVKVSVDYKPGFKKYFTDYSVQVATTGDSLTFVRDEARAGFFAVGDLGLKVTMTRQNGKLLTYEPPVIRGAHGPEHYKFTFDVTGGAGGSTLVISFDDSADSRPIEIDLDQDWIPNAAPFITPTGFANEEPIVMYRGTQRNLSLLATARNQIASCVLRTTSAPLQAAGWPAEVDLVTADEATKTILRNLGLQWTEGVADPSQKLQMAQIDFSAMAPKLDAGEHLFEIEVKDKVAQQNQPLALRMIVQQPTFSFVDEQPKVFLNAVGAQLQFAMPTGSMSDVVIERSAGWSRWEECPYQVISNNAGLYYLFVQVAFSNKPITLRATEKNSTRSAMTTVGVELSKFELARVPAGDVWSNRAYLNIAMQEGANLDQVVVQRQEDGGQWVACTTNALNPTPTSVRMEVVDLTPGKQYTFRAQYGGMQTTAESVVATEPAAQLPNAGLNNWNPISLENIFTGGRPVNMWGTKRNPGTRTVTSYSLPGWATVNNKTANRDANVENGRQTSPNTWYIVPSTERTTELKEGAFAAMIRSVAWHNNADTPDNSWKAANDNGTSNMPGSLIRSVGKLFLGSYDVAFTKGTNGPTSEVYDQGVAFGSRPAQITGQYKYVPMGTDKGYLRAAVVNYTGIVRTVLAEVIIRFDAAGNYQTFTGTFNYTRTDLPATNIEVMFASSDKLSESWQAENSAGIQTSTNDWSNFYSVGSALYIDDVKLLY